MRVHHPESRVALVLLCALLVACGSSGSGGGVDSTPTISNLRYSPRSVVQGSGGGSATVTGTFDFRDAGGDLTTLHLRLSSGSDVRGAIPGAAGVTSGTLQAQFAVSTATLGHYTFEVWVSDAAGNGSNVLAGSFDVILDDTASQWTVRSLPGNSAAGALLHAVTWTGSLHVAVGTKIFTSPDAVTWTERATAQTFDLRAVAWTGTQLVAVGVGGTVLTSNDGVTWVEQSIPLVSDPNLWGVASSGGRIVAVGEQRDGLGQVESLMLSSTDGVSWGAGPVIPDAVPNGVTWSGTQFVAVGVSTGQALSGPMSLVSPDGLGWTVHRPGPGVDSSFRNVVHGGSLYVATGYPANAASPDGMSWQQGSGATNGLGLGWSGYRFLSCGVLYCHSSTDGFTWGQTAATLPGPPATTVLGLTWGDGRWVAVGYSGTGSAAAVLTSP
jgi:hypothetical protein